MNNMKRGCGCIHKRQNRWLEASLLYLLHDHAKHGYTLLSELPELGFINGQIDAGAVYRTLRHLEEFHFVESEWDTTGSGPAKRSYQITESGKKHLADWRETLKERIVNLNAFLAKIENLA